jgi:hypothetical protein
MLKKTLSLLGVASVIFPSLLIAQPVLYPIITGGSSSGGNASVATNAPDGSPVASVTVLNKQILGSKNYSLPTSLQYPPNFTNNVILPLTNGMLIKVLHTNGTSSLYGTNVNTINAGHTLLISAVNAATDGDVFFITPGIYTCDGGDHSGWFAGTTHAYNVGISVVGSGKDNTGLTGTIMELGGLSSFRDISITNTSITPQLDYSLTTSNNPHWNINVKFSSGGAIDIWTLSSLNSSWVFQNCDFSFPYDCFAGDGNASFGSVIYCINNRYYSYGGSGILQTGVKYNDMAYTAYVYNDTIVSFGATNAYGVYSRYGGTTYAYNTAITTTSTGTNADFFAEGAHNGFGNSTNFISSDCTFSPAKVMGITSYSLFYPNAIPFAAGMTTNISTAILSTRTMYITNGVIMNIK